MADMDERGRALARRVQAERERRSWTQKDLADAAGVSLGTVGNFELQKTTPQATKLRKILGALDLEAEAGDAQAAETREGWEPDVQIFLDLMGLYLSALPDDERGAVMTRITGQVRQAMTSRS